MTHAAKAAMLIALSRGQLSAQGQRRAQTHLSNCEVCRNAQTGIRHSQRLLAEARTIETPAINYDAMTFALRQEARTQATRHSRRTLRNALAIAAAIALAALGATRFFTDESVSTNSTTAAAPTSTTTTPTSNDAADGDDFANHTETTHAMTTRPEFKLVAGLLVSADAGDVVLRPWDGTEMILAQGSLARVVEFDAQARPHRLHVELLRGSIDNRVAPLQPGDLYAIEVNRHVVRVVGTRFVVTRTQDQKAQVVLHEGQVDITRGDAVVANLRAPATWVEDTTQLNTGLSATPTGHDVREGDGTAPMERVIGKPNRATNPSSGKIAPTAIQHLLARAAPLLRACHDQSKRNHPDQPTALQLELSVAASGQVEGVVVRAQAEQLGEHQGELPEELVRCLRERALTWHLPLQVAGPVKVRVPLQFGPAR